MTKRILSVSYNESLLQTREMLLRRHGHSVTSALGFTDAVEQCRNSHFELMILGHSIPNKDKRQLINLFHDNCPGPVLALLRHGENAPDGADDHIYPDDIDALLEAVDKLREKPKKFDKSK
jgi:DNA-binding response OmpR family regulator